MTEQHHTDELELLVTCPKGIEQLLEEELIQLGATPGKTTVAGIYVRASLATAYRLCLWSRLANRVILVLARTPMVDTAAQLLSAVTVCKQEETYVCPPQ